MKSVSLPYSLVLGIGQCGSSSDSLSNDSDRTTIFYDLERLEGQIIHFNTLFRFVYIPFLAITLSSTQLKGEIHLPDLYLFLHLACVLITKGSDNISPNLTLVVVSVEVCLINTFVLLSSPSDAVFLDLPKRRPFWSPQMWARICYLIILRFRICSAPDLRFAKLLCYSQLANRVVFIPYLLVLLKVFCLFQVTYVIIDVI